MLPQFYQHVILKINFNVTEIFSCGLPMARWGTKAWSYDIAFWCHTLGDTTYHGKREFHMFGKWPWVIQFVPA